MFDLASDAAELASLVASAQEEITQILFPHRCDLWKLSYPTQDDTKRLKDPRYEIVARNQHCQYIPTPEADEPGVVGRFRNDNFETLDQFWFPTGTDVEDQYVVINKNPGDNHNRIWIIQGNTKSLDYDPLRPVTYQMVLAANSPKLPPGVTL